MAFIVVAGNRWRCGVGGHGEFRCAGGFEGDDGAGAQQQAQGRVERQVELFATGESYTTAYRSITSTTRRPEQVRAPLEAAVQAGVGCPDCREFSDARAEPVAFTQTD